MDNKKIPTWLGVTIIIIFAATALAFVLVRENNNRMREVKNNVIHNQLEKRINASQVNQLQEKEITAAEEIIKNNDTPLNSEEISFCGKTYQSEKVLINKVDVIKAIAKISKKENWLCENLVLGKFQESGIDIAHKKDSSKSNAYLVAIFHRNNQTEMNDPFNQSPYIFQFDFNSNQISSQSQFDAKFTPLGTIQ